MISDLPTTHAAQLAASDADRLRMLLDQQRANAAFWRQRKAADEVAFYDAWVSTLARALRAVEAEDA